MFSSWSAGSRKLSREQRNYSPDSFQPKERQDWPALGGNRELCFYTCSGCISHLKVSGFEANRWVWRKSPLECDQISWNCNYFLLLLSFKIATSFFWVIFHFFTLIVACIWVLIALLPCALVTNSVGVNPPKKFHLEESRGPLDALHAKASQRPIHSLQIDLVL